MAAAITDLFNEPTTTSRPDAGALTAQKLIGAASITVDTTAGWPSATAVHFVIYQVTAAGVRVEGTQTEWKGIVTSSTAIGTLTLQAGTDQVYPIGSKVICTPTAAWGDDLVEGILVSHNQDGTMITSLPLTTPKITTSINDTNGNEIIKTPATASAVNEITVTNAATGNAPNIAATGGDTNINLRLQAKGTGGVWIDEYQPYKFRAYRAAAANAGVNSVFAKIVFDTESYDTNSNFATGTYTAPVAGFYHFEWRAKWVTGGAEQYQSALYKNGAAISLGTNSTAPGVAHVTTTGSDTIELAANDTIDVYCTNSAAGAKALEVGATACFISGFLVSRT